MITLPYRRDAENKDTEMEKDDREKKEEEDRRLENEIQRKEERGRGGGFEFYIKIIKCSPGEMEMDGRKEKE